MLHSPISPLIRFSREWRSPILSEPCSSPSSGTCCVCPLAARSTESGRVRKDITVEPPRRSFPEVGFLICGAFAEWVRQSSVCGSVGYPFKHADSGKVAWPANFFCGKRAQNCWTSLIDRRPRAPPTGTSRNPPPVGESLRPYIPNGHRVSKSLHVVKEIFVVAICQSRISRSGVPSHPDLS